MIQQKGRTIVIGIHARTGAALAATGMLLLAACGQKPPALTADEVTAIATDAYVFGYPLVTMDMTRRVMTNVAQPEGTRAPMGRFVNMRTYPDASFRDVTAPNANTLYSSAWVDVSAEPVVFSLPEMGDRYFLMPMLDGWTTVFQVPGSRTTGGHAQTYLITGPGWSGTVPEGMTEYKSPTAMVWILGRTFAQTTPADLAAVHALQDQYVLVPLSSYGKPYTPPPGVVDPSLDMKTAVRDQVNGLSATEFFSRLAALMKQNPPTAADSAIVSRMARLGIVAGQPFDPSKLDSASAAALAAVPKAAVEKIMALSAQIPKVNGWSYGTQTGVYGTDYLVRALVTAIGLGANRPQDAIYPYTESDATGAPLDGGKKYVLHFPKGQVPPVHGFWSLTMYDANYFFVANPINRYQISPTQSPVKFNADSSLDVIIQSTPPAKDRMENWLPAPTGPFILMLRFYWPDDAIINGSWKPPAVTVAK